MMELPDQSPPFSAPVHCKDMAASKGIMPSCPGQAARTAVDDEGSNEPGVSECSAVSTPWQQERGTIPPYHRESAPAIEPPEERPAASEPTQGDIR